MINTIHIMFKSILVSCLLCVANARILFTQSEVNKDVQTHDYQRILLERDYDMFARKLGRWTSWMNTYNKTYESDKEWFVRFMIFAENDEKINSHNQNNDYQLGHNQFSDMTNYEFKQKMLTCHYNMNQQYMDMNFDMNFTQNNETLDWRIRGVVSPVKDQGQCGSCWAFSTVVTLEGSYALKHNNLTTFSEQQLVDCSTVSGNFGCNGGWPFWTYTYLLNNNVSVDTESQYPYVATDQTCNASQSNYSLYGYLNVTSGSEDDLALKLNLAPVSVCIDAGSLEFQLYKSGVYVDTTCHNGMYDLDHCVGLVGYSSDPTSGQQYWIVKNSWSTTWGDNGYIYMARNMSNMCGIATAATLAVMK